MNKVITIRLGHYVLTADEDAAQVIAHYSDALRKKYAGDESAKEIVEDIEERIGELLQKKQTEKMRSFTTLEDVQDVIAQMGPLEGGQDSGSQETYQYNPKRLYRDPDNKILAGVWGGIAAYFDIDPVILRAAWVISVFVFGFGIPLYIVLWIVMPEANTTAEKLMMRGQRPTLQNIEDNIKNEFSQVKNKFNSPGTRNRFASFIGALATAFATVFMWIIKIIFSFLGGILIACLIAILIGFFTDNIHADFRHFIINGQSGLDAILNSGGNAIAIKISLVTFILLCIAVVGITIFSSNKNRERMRMPRRYLAWATTIMFLILFAFVFDSVRLFRNRTERMLYRETLDVKGDTLFIASDQMNYDAPGFFTLNSFDDILVSEDSFFHIEQYNEIYGNKKYYGSVNSTAYPRRYNFNDNIMHLQSGEQLTAKEKPEMGWSRFTLYVPRGKWVKAKSNIHFEQNNRAGIYAAGDAIFIDSSGTPVYNGKTGRSVNLSESFSDLRIHGKFDVILIPASTNKMELVSGPILNHPSWIRNEGDELILDADYDEFLEHNSVIKIYSREIQNIELSSVGSVQFRTWKCGSMNIECSGASKLEGNIQAENLNIDMEGASKASLKGNATDLDLHISGACDFDCNGLQVQNMHVRESGASNVHAWVTSSIKGKVSGGSDLNIKGNPPVSDVETSGASNYERVH